MKLYQQSIGEGPELVLLHGWGLHSGIWSASPDSLLSLLSRDYRMTMFDLPGHGHSSDVGEPGFTATVNMIAEQMPQSVVLLGWSLGGLLALQLACQFPHRIKALILIASNARFTRTSDWLTALAPETLDGFADDLVENPETTVRLTGHADATGSSDYNMLLSHQRVDQVAGYLEVRGIDPGRIFREGRGDTSPVARNSYPDGTDAPLGPRYGLTGETISSVEHMDIPTEDKEKIFTRNAMNLLRLAI